MTKINKQTQWLGTLALMTMMFLYSCGSGEQPMGPTGPVQAETIRIDTATTLTYRDYPGTIEGKVNVEIRPQVDGYLKEVFVDEGAYVKAGQNLFRIQDLPYREQLNSATASLHAAEAALASAQLEIDKLTPLVQNKVVSDIQLKTAKSAYQMAHANVEQARSQVGAAKINLDFTLIKAPVAGFIGRLPKKTGSLVGRNDPQPLTLLSDVHEVHAYFAMGETDFIQFKSQHGGKTLQEKLLLLPAVELLLADNSIYAQKGKIDMVDGQFDKSTGAITVRATFPNQQGLLRSGNTGKVRLGRQHLAAILVPQSATIEIQDKVFVFEVSKQNKVYKKPIEIIGTSGTDYLVSSGVKAGSTIVFSGLDKLQEGAVIQPQPVQTTHP